MSSQSSYFGQYFFQLALDDPTSFLTNFASELLRFANAKYVVVGLCSQLCKTIHPRAVASCIPLKMNVAPTLQQADFASDNCTATWEIDATSELRYWRSVITRMPSSIERWESAGLRYFSTFVLNERNALNTEADRPVFFGQIYSDSFIDTPDELPLVVGEGWRGFKVAHRERLHRALDLTNRFSRFTVLGNVLNDLVDSIATALPCEGVTFFVVSPSRQMLLMTATTGFRWAHSPIAMQHYLRGEGITGGVWESAKPYCTINAELESGAILKSAETVSNSNKHFTLWYPVLSANDDKVMGVIRCRNRIGNFGVSGFSDFDFDIVKWISDATKSIFEILYEDAASNAALGWLSHELKLALGPIKSAAVEINQSPKTANYPALKSDCEYVIATVHEMSRAIKNTDLLRKWPAKIISRRSLTQIDRDVIPAAIENVQALINRFNIKRSQLVIDPSIADAPVCRVDREQLVHVLSNIIANSITYCNSQSENVRIRVYFEVGQAIGRIVVEDWGVGFDSERVESYFRAGMRHPHSHRFIGAGQGLGLWCSRWLMKNIGGDVCIDQFFGPTRVAVTFPLIRVNS